MWDLLLVLKRLLRFSRLQIKTILSACCRTGCGLFWGQQTEILRIQETPVNQQSLNSHNPRSFRPDSTNQAFLFRDQHLNFFYFLYLIKILIKVIQSRAVSEFVFIYFFTLTLRTPSAVGKLGAVTLRDDAWIQYKDKHPIYFFNRVKT